MGRELLKELRLRGLRLRAAARDPLAASQYIDAETDWICFDYQKEETLAPAPERVDRALMILPPSGSPSAPPGG